MSTRMLVDARHPEETRVTVVKGSRVEDFDYESSTRRQLKGNIYLARVTRVEPSLQAAFVEYGGNRHGFLAFSEIHPDYYQIPLEDREAIIEEETAAAAAEKAAEEAAAEEEAKKRRPRRRRGRRSVAEKTENLEATVSEEADAATEGEAKEELVQAGDVSEQAEASDKDEADTAGTDNDLTTSDALVDTDARADTKESDTDEADVPTGEQEGLGEDSADVKESDEEEKEAEIEAAANRRRSLRALKRRYSIQEVIKRRQVLLIQVVKEERGNKGAALTTYLSLAGRYCVLMPNSTHSGGISRKISNLSDRKKLKQVINSLEVPEDMGLIVRTAGINRTKTEIKRDYDYLLRLWNGIRDLTLKSIAPALIYEEGNLIKRTIRDVYTRDIDEIWVEGEKGYRAAKDFMKLLMPSHAKKVQHYKDRIPLYHRYQVENQLEAMYQPVVQLKSGGYIVINPTEALISIDVNSGRATKEHNIEETAVKTNLEAAEEVARQLRLRDMAGLVVIDFIDMEDRGNNRAVERRMKDVLKSDRARIQVGRISSFGLMEMSRQRLRPNLLEVAMETCTNCAGTGLVRSVESASLMALRQLEEEGIRNRSSVVRVSASPDVAIYLLNQKRSDLFELERQYKFTIQVLAQSNFGPSDIELTRETGSDERASNVSDDAVVKVDSAPPIQESPETTTETNNSPEQEDQPRKKRRRRRRRRRGGSDDQDVTQVPADQAPEKGGSEEKPDDDKADEDKTEGSGRRRRGSRGGRRRRGRDEQQAAQATTDNSEETVSQQEEVSSDVPAPEAENVKDSKAEKPRRRRRVKKSEDTSATSEAEAKEAQGSTDKDSDDAKDKPSKGTPRRRTRRKAAETTEPANTESVDNAEVDTANEDESEKQPVRPRRRRTSSATAKDVEADTDNTADEKPRRRRAPRKSADGDATKNSEAKSARKPRKKTAKDDGDDGKPQETKNSSLAEPATEGNAPPKAAPASTNPDQPKKKGWWQRTFG